MENTSNYKKYVFIVLVLSLVYFGSINLHKAFQQEPLPQMIKSPSINRPFDFAGEAIPMSNQDVLDRLDRELIMNTYLHGSTLLNLKMASRYFPMIEPILKENGIPDDFKYLVPVESNFTNATSPSGAKGFWQFMAPTAKELGLRINDKVDERYNVELATKAACVFINDLYRRFGNWTLTAAAYNGGAGRISKELKAQKVSNFYDLYLNAETSKYVFRILAIKEVMSDPESFGYDIEQVNMYKPIQVSKRLTIDTSITSLTNFAISNGTTYKMLRYMNPWITDRDLPVAAGKSYEILIP